MRHDGALPHLFRASNHGQDTSKLYPKMRDGKGHVHSSTTMPSVVAESLSFHLNSQNSSGFLDGRVYLPESTPSLSAFSP